MTWAETRRKAAHMAAFWPALLLPFMTPLQAMGAAFLLVLMNIFVLPRAAKGLYRAEASGMGALEIILYPSALMACVAAFGADGGAGPVDGGGKPGWYLPVGAAWFALAVVDAFIGIACRLFPHGPALPWNRRKPIPGVVLGTLASAFPAAALAHLALPPLSTQDWVALGLLLAVAVIAETAWFGVADNLVIPFFLCVLIPLVPNPLADIARSDPASVLSSLSSPSSMTWRWALVPIGFGVLAWSGRMLTLGGAVLGAIMALLLILADPYLFLFLGGFFALANLATRFGFARKQALRIAEARNGRRGAAEVFGAMGMAAWMTPLVHLAKAAADADQLHAALLVAVAPLVAKTMDTVSSEIGKAVGGTTISLRTFRPVPPGTEGGVSLGGTLCGLAAAGIMAAAVLPLGWGGWTDVLVLLAIALAANVFESYWGEYAARRDLDQGPHTNVLMTLFAAVAAWVIFSA